jgi:hypothetical protein
MTIANTARATLAFPFVSLVALLAFAACSSSSSSSPSTSGSDDAGVQSDAAPMMCTTVGFAAGSVTPVAVTGAAPPATGGAIKDGVYRLTKYEVYNVAVDPLTAPKIKGSIEFASGMYAIAFVSSKDGTGEDNETGTFKTSGAMLTFTMQCPGQAAEQAQRYSVSGNTFMLYDVSKMGATDPVEIGTYTLE